MEKNTIIIIVGIIIALSFVYAYDIGGIKTTINKAVLMSGSCPDYIIPEKVTMVDLIVKTEKSSIKYGNSRTYVMSDMIDNPRTITSNWKDGARIQVPQYSTFNQYCSKGNSVGENKNYYYCKNLVYNNPFEELSDDETIMNMGSIEYVISLELKPLGSVQFIESAQVSGSLYSLTEVEIEGEARKGENYDLEIQQFVGSQEVYGYKTPYYIDYEVISSSCKRV